jgi:hypothetical protein
VITQVSHEQPGNAHQTLTFVGTNGRTDMPLKNTAIDFNHRHARQARQFEMLGKRVRFVRRSQDQRMHPVPQQIGDHLNLRLDGASCLVNDGNSMVCCPRPYSMAQNGPEGKTRIVQNTSQE